MSIPQEKALSTIKRWMDEHLKTHPSIIVGIDGMAASGKTTLAEALKSDYKAAIIHMDDFFLQDHQRTKERLLETDGFVDYERFHNEVLKPLKKKESFTYHAYDCTSKTMSERFVGSDFEVCIIEGAYALREAFQTIYDLKVLVLINPDTQRSRIESRNPPELVKRFMQEWIPRENRYIDHFNLQEVADLVVDVK